VKEFTVKIQVPSKSTPSGMLRWLNGQLNSHRMQVTEVTDDQALKLSTDPSVLFDSLDPLAYDIMPFPDEKDRGDKTGDEQLADIICYGTTSAGSDEKQLLFAIKLGRALEKRGS
jgi:hypothetical protein